MTHVPSEKMAPLYQYPRNASKESKEWNSMILLRYFLVAFQILRCESRSSREGSIDDPGAPRAIEELTPFCAKR
jgi:hypothetical protein